MGSIYHCNMTAQETRVLEELRLRMAKEMGVTVVGNRVTGRFSFDGELCDVHMIVEHIDTPKELGGYPVRTIVRIETNPDPDGNFQMILPGWNSGTLIPMNLAMLPMHMRPLIKQNFRCHVMAPMNAEYIAEIYHFENWETS